MGDANGLGAAVAAARWSVEFVERGCRDGVPVKDVSASARVALGALPPFVPGQLLGMDCPVFATDRHGQLWSLVARVRGCEIDERKGEVALRAVGVGTPRRVFVTRVSLAPADPVGAGAS